MVTSEQTCGRQNHSPQRRNNDPTITSQSGAQYIPGDGIDLPAMKLLKSPPQSLTSYMDEISISTRQEVRQASEIMVSCCGQSLEGDLTAALGYSMSLAATLQTLSPSSWTLYMIQRLRVSWTKQLPMSSTSELQSVQTSSRASFGTPSLPLSLDHTRILSFSPSLTF
jgi:hypothetical protein